MTDGFDDGFENNEENRFRPLNAQKIPAKRTAVALKDSNEGQKVPRIAAAGRGYIADKILELAFAHNIKIRRDNDLAELLAQIELDSPIPGEAFMAVGEILSYIYRANNHPNPFETSPLTLQENP